MSFLGMKELEILAKDCIEPFDPKRLKNASYELSLGNQAYVTDSKSQKIDYLDNKNSVIDINPGQFALLLTKEKVRVPNTNIALISIKAGEKLKGLVNVSGFHVDPGFNDHLLFSVYNAGPAPIVLRSDEPYFLLWYAELKSGLSEEEAYGKNNEHFKKLGSIPTKYLESLKRGELASPNVLLDRIKSNEATLKNWLWAAGIIIGLCIAITLKLYMDSSKFENGYIVGVKEKAIKEGIDSAYKKSNMDSIISNKVDSILKTKKTIIQGKP